MYKLHGEPAQFGGYPALIKGKNVYLPEDMSLNNPFACFEHPELAEHYGLAIDDTVTARVVDRDEAHFGVYEKDLQQYQTELKAFVEFLKDFEPDVVEIICDDKIINIF